jgi:hypothetical protein
MRTWDVRKVNQIVGVILGEQYNTGVGRLESQPLGGERRQYRCLPHSQGFVAPRVSPNRGGVHSRPFWSRN